MEKEKKRRYVHSQAEKELFDELNAYQENGCRICLDGKDSYPSKVVSACFREHSEYMRDIVGDEDEKISKIDFIRLKREKR